jgi:heme/copper-type cytochrome/quinol oxidase subunit 2
MAPAFPFPPATPPQRQLSWSIWAIIAVIVIILVVVSLVAMYAPAY